MATQGPGRAPNTQEGQQIRSERTKSQTDARPRDQGTRGPGDAQAVCCSRRGRCACQPPPAVAGPRAQTAQTCGHWKEGRP